MPCGDLVYPRSFRQSRRGGKKNPSTSDQCQLYPLCANSGHSDCFMPPMQIWWTCIVPSRPPEFPNMGSTEPRCSQARQLHAKKSASDACSKTRHDDDNRHLHHALERYGVEVSLHPITDFFHIEIGLLQFQANENIDRRQESQTLDCHQGHQN